MKLEKTLKEDRHVRGLTYEYILPDYEGTLKRVMMCDAKVMHTSTTRLREELVMGGTVRFSMLYLNTEDALASLGFEVPFECSFRIDPETETVIDELQLASFSCLPSGPRRIVAKAEVVARTVEVGAYEVEEMREGDDVMLLHEAHTYHTTVYSNKEEREYAEEIFSSEKEIRVLFCDSSIRLAESRVMKDGVTVSGVCQIRTLICEGEERARGVSGEIAFEEFVPMGEPLGEQVTLIPTVSLVALSVDVQKEEDIWHLVANPTLCFFIRAVKENKASFAVDAYSTRYEGQAQYENLVLKTQLPLVSYKEKLECRLPKTEGDPVPMCSVLFAKSEGHLVECTPDDGVVYLLLKLSHSVVGSDEVVQGAGESEGEGEPQKKEITFVRARKESAHALNIPLPACTKDTACHIHSLFVSSPEIYEEEDGLLLVCEVSFVLSSVREVVLPVSSKIENSTRERVREKDALVITYPDSTTTLWHLAKEHGVSVRELLTLNPTVSVSEEKWNDMHSLSGVKYLLLP